MGERNKIQNVLFALNWPGRAALPGRHGLSQAEQTLLHSTLPGLAVPKSLPSLGDSVSASLKWTWHSTFLLGLPPGQMGQRAPGTGAGTQWCSISGALHPPLPPRLCTGGPTFQGRLSPLPPKFTPAPPCPEGLPVHGEAQRCQQMTTVCAQGRKTAGVKEPTGSWQAPWKEWHLKPVTKGTQHERGSGCWEQEGWPP